MLRYADILRLMLPCLRRHATPFRLSRTATMMLYFPCVYYALFRAHYDFAYFDAFLYFDEPLFRYAFFTISDDAIFALLFAAATPLRLRHLIYFRRTPRAAFTPYDTFCRDVSLQLRYAATRCMIRYAITPAFYIRCCHATPYATL